MAAPNLIPQGGGAFVGSIPRAPDPTPLEINIIYKERMPAPDSILQGGGTFVGSIPRAPGPTPPKKLILFTRARREEARFLSPGSRSRSS
jgi:hypothetical protein